MARATARRPARSPSCWASTPPGTETAFRGRGSQAKLAHGRLHRKLAHNRALARKVALLEKIADQPEAQRFSLYSAGGGPGAIFAQVQKIFCHNLTADPGTIPIITTFFLYQAGYCETSSEIVDHRPTFERQVNEMVAGIERRPAVMLLELDAIGSSSCMARNGALPEWEADIRYEMNAVVPAPARRGLRRGWLLGRQQPGLHRPRAERRRGAEHPRLLYQRHAPELDGQRDPLGREGLTA